MRGPGERSSFIGGPAGTDNDVLVGPGAAARPGAAAPRALRMRLRAGERVGGRRRLLRRGAVPVQLRARASRPDLHERAGSHVEAARLDAARVGGRGPLWGPCGRGQGCAQGAARAQRRAGAEQAQHGQRREDVREEEHGERGPHHVAQHVRREPPRVLADAADDRGRGLEG